VEETPSGMEEDLDSINSPNFFFFFFFKKITTK
jgi:hypothetical protein